MDPLLVSPTPAPSADPLDLLSLDIFQDLRWKNITLGTRNANEVATERLCFPLPTEEYAIAYRALIFKALQDIDAAKRTSGTFLHPPHSHLPPLYPGGPSPPVPSLYYQQEYASHVAQFLEDPSAVFFREDIEPSLQWILSSTPRGDGWELFRHSLREGRTKMDEHRPLSLSTVAPIIPTLILSCIQCLQEQWLLSRDSVHDTFRKMTALWGHSVLEILQHYSRPFPVSVLPGTGTSPSPSPSARSQRLLDLELLYPGNLIYFFLQSKIKEYNDLQLEAIERILVRSFFRSIVEKVVPLLAPAEKTAMVTKLVRRDPSVGKNITRAYLENPYRFVALFPSKDEFERFRTSHLLFEEKQIQQLDAFLPHQFPACQCFYSSSFEYETEEWVSFAMEKCRLSYPGRPAYTLVSTPLSTFSSSSNFSVALLDSPCLLQINRRYFPSGLHYLFFILFSRLGITEDEKEAYSLLLLDPSSTVQYKSTTSPDVLRQQFPFCLFEELTVRLQHYLKEKRKNVSLTILRDAWKEHHTQWGLRLLWASNLSRPLRYEDPDLPVFLQEPLSKEWTNLRDGYGTVKQRSWTNQILQTSPYYRDSWDAFETIFRLYQSVWGRWSVLSSPSSAVQLTLSTFLFSHFPFLMVERALPLPPTPDTTTTTLLSSSSQGLYHVLSKWALHVASFCQSRKCVYRRVSAPKRPRQADVLLKIIDVVFHAVEYYLAQHPLSPRPEDTPSFEAEMIPFRLFLASLVRTWAPDRFQDTTSDAHVQSIVYPYLVVSPPQTTEKKHLLETRFQFLMYDISSTHPHQTTSTRKEIMTRARHTFESHFQRLFALRPSFSYFLHALPTSSKRQYHPLFEYMVAIYFTTVALYQHIDPFHLDCLSSAFLALPPLA